MMIVTALTILVAAYLYYIPTVSYPTSWSGYGVEELQRTIWFAIYLHIGSIICLLIAITLSLLRTGRKAVLLFSLLALIMLCVSTAPESTNDYFINSGGIFVSMVGLFFCIAACVLISKRDFLPSPSKTGIGIPKETAGPVPSTGQEPFERKDYSNYMKEKRFSEEIAVLMFIIAILGIVAIINSYNGPHYATGNTRNDIDAYNRDYVIYTIVLISGIAACWISCFCLTLLKNWRVSFLSGTWASVAISATFVPDSKFQFFTSYLYYTDEYAGVFAFISFILVLIASISIGGMRTNVVFSDLNIRVDHEKNLRWWTISLLFATSILSWLYSISCLVVPQIVANHNWNVDSPNIGTLSIATSALGSGSSILCIIAIILLYSQRLRWGALFLSFTSFFLLLSSIIWFNDYYLRAHTSMLLIPGLILGFIAWLMTIKLATKYYRTDLNLGHRPLPDLRSERP